MEYLTDVTSVELNLLAGHFSNNTTEDLWSLSNYKICDPKRADNSLQEGVRAA